MSAIIVENLSKCYQIGRQVRHDTLRDAVIHTLGGLLPVRRKDRQAEAEDFWALRDVSFKVEPGEVVGIIGRNGAGKSTLLKILSRITEPTQGRIKINGRVASLLEVGTGFHPELTGRDNIYLNGAILGMSRVEIRKKFDEIVAFAEVEKFLDTPVKRYSSGMYVRLAFAVAAHLEPEILIVDEVLAVGDAAFQKKCLGKINQVSREEGRTVLFVSHNMGVVANLCSRAILMENGRVHSIGSAPSVVAEYTRSKNELSGQRSWIGSDISTGNTRLRLHQARVRCGNDITADVLIDTPVIIEYEFEVIGSAQNITTSIHLYDKQGVWVLCSGSPSAVLAAGHHQHTVTLPANFLNDGAYSVSIILLTEVTQIQVFKTDAISFFVHETGIGREEYGGIINGCVRPQLNWTATSLGSAP